MINADDNAYNILLIYKQMSICNAQIQVAHLKGQSP